MRFLVFSDLHLDHAVDGRGPTHLAQQAAARRACLDRLLGLADTHQVDAILSAGDLYDHRCLQPDTASFLVDRLGRAGRPVFLAPGDQDPHTPESLYATAAWPANVHVFSDDLLVPVELADGFRLWGAAHRCHGATPGFLDGFRITDESVNLALFHGSEVGTPAHGDAPVVAPFRAEQVAQAGLTHAFVGHARAAVDAPWHTSPGAPDPLDGGASDPRGAVIVDVAPDGSLRRRRFGVATSQVHEVIIDLTDAASLDEVLERLVVSIEDLQGTVRVGLQGRPASDVVVLDEEITSWSTDRLEVVLGPRSGAAAPAAEGPREVTVAHDAPQEAPASLQRHTGEHHPAPIRRPDLGGLDPDTLEAHVRALRARPTVREKDPRATVDDPEAAPPRQASRTRAVARAVAALVTVSAAIGLLLLGDTVAERVLPAMAIAIVVVVIVTTRRGAVEGPESEFAADRVRARARAALLDHLEHGAELERARHAAATALREAGLPTEPDALEALVEAARRAEGQRAHEQNLGVIPASVGTSVAVAAPVGRCWDRSQEPLVHATPSDLGP